ncbi:hypothetical protein ELI45_38815 [Rhizobium ruizarguesonis]|nr:hypothetical protein ELI45_38815 [Rhizobium ruizarguesonis]
MWSPFVLSKQTESQLADFTQLFFGQALRFLGAMTICISTPALQFDQQYEPGAEGLCSRR